MSVVAVAAHRTMRLFAVASIALGLVSVAGATTVSAEAGRTLVQPADLDLFFLTYQAAGVEPPFAVLAGRDPKVGQADEFTRQKAAEEVERQLRARAESVRDVRFLQLNLNATFGEYDSRYGEFTFAGLGDGTYISSGSPFGSNVRVALINGGQAQGWPLDAQEAEAVLQRNRGERWVTLVLRLEIVGAAQPVDGVPLVLDTKIVGFDVMAGDGRTRLGRVALDR